MENLTAFQRDLLYIAASFDRPHGLAIKEQLEQYYEQDVKNGRLYPNLDDLVEEGLINKGQIDRRTNSYTITEKGKRLLKSRHRWENQYVETN